MTQNNLRIIFDNLHDVSTLTATSEALPIEYTQRSGRSYRWRSTDTTQQIITGTLPSPNYSDAVVLLQNNFSVSANVQIELLLDNNVVYSSGFKFPSELKPLGEWVVGVDPWGLTNLSLLPVRQYVVWLQDIVLYDSYRITIQDADNPDGYIQIGRIFVGQYYSPKFNASYGVSFEDQDFGENVRTESGSLRTVGEGSARAVTFDLDTLNAGGLSDLTINLLKTGKEKDIYLNIYPEQGGVLEGIHAFVARRSSNYSTNANYFNNWRSSLSFEEV